MLLSFKRLHSRPKPTNLMNLARHMRTFMLNDAGPWPEGSSATDMGRIVSLNRYRGMPHMVDHAEGIRLSTSRQFLDFQKPAPADQ